MFPKALCAILAYFCSDHLYTWSIAICFTLANTCLQMFAFWNEEEIVGQLSVLWCLLWLRLLFLLSVQNSSWILWCFMWYNWMHFQQKGNRYQWHFIYLAKHYLHPQRLGKISQDVWFWRFRYFPLAGNGYHSSYTLPWLAAILRAVRQNIWVPREVSRWVAR